MSSKCTQCKNPISNNNNTCEWCGFEFENQKNNLSNNINSNNIDNELLKLSPLEAVKKHYESNNSSIKDSKKYVDDLFKKNNKKNGCFIATACFDNYDAPEVIIFRNFRDNYLQKYYLGQNFIRLYYHTSPPIAKLISKSEFAKKTVRIILLNPFLKFLKKRY